VKLVDKLKTFDISLGKMRVLLAAARFKSLCGWFCSLNNRRNHFGRIAQTKDSSNFRTSNVHLNFFCHFADDNTYKISMFQYFIFKIWTHLFQNLFQEKVQLHENDEDKRMATLTAKCKNISQCSNTQKENFKFCHCSCILDRSLLL